MKTFYTARLGALLALLFLLSLIAAGQSSPYLEYASGKVWIKNLNKEVLYTFTRYNHDQSDWKAVFPVSLKDVNAISIDGKYDVFETAVSFTPRFPFAAGIVYRATFHTDQLAHNPNEVYLPATDPASLALEFSFETITHEQPRVASVFPSSDTLPENLLKFHIAFNVPMKAGEVYDHVKLLDEKGNQIEKAFLVVDQEFWDEKMTMVTILLDPGRLKRGLRGHLEMKAPLQSEQRFFLVVDKGWQNIDGTTMERDFVKSFYCTDADRKSPTESTLRLVTPKSPNDPLAFIFGESMDAVTSASHVRIIDSQNNQIEGTTELLPQEKGFIFKPKKNWSHETYTVLINPLIEDLAGNNFNRVFDRDLKIDGENRNLKTIRRTFAIAISQ